MQPGDFAGAGGRMVRGVQRHQVHVLPSAQPRGPARGAGVGHLPKRDGSLAPADPGIAPTS